MTTVSRVPDVPPPSVRRWYGPRTELERLARELGIDPWDLRAALRMEVDQPSRERAARR